MMTQKAPDTSVLFSLAELAEIEQERIHEEEQQQSQLREQRQRERRLALERERQQETARIVAESEARLAREREEAQAKARLLAREQAAADVARIEAEAKARLEADNAQRAHELEVIRTRTERGGRRLQRALGVALGLVLCAGSAVSYGLTRQVTRLEQEGAGLRATERSLEQARDDLLRAELGALDRRRATLEMHRPALDDEPARHAAEAARQAIEPERPEPGALHAYRAALDHWQARREALGRRAALDRRLGDLRAWASRLSATELAAAAGNAANRAHVATADDAALGAYEQALDELRTALEAAGSTHGSRGSISSAASSAAGTCTDPHDPWCGLDGKPLLPH